VIDVGRVAMIPIGEVMISPDRAREVMGDLTETEANMKEVGLISPIAVEDNKDGTYSLLAGERRFTIIKRHNGTQSSIPARVFEAEKLTPYLRKVIEKSENFFRKDMEYFEMDKLTLEIHRMMQDARGIKRPGPGNKGWSLDNTAEMLGGSSKPVISQSIKRAELREQFPQLFTNCKTIEDATKLIKRVSVEATKEMLAQQIVKKQSNTPLSKLADSFIIKDCLIGLNDIPDGVFHLVEIDPPYGIDLTLQKKKDGESQYTLNNYNEIDKSDYPSFLQKLLSQTYRVMVKHSWLIFWFAPEPWFELVYREICRAGFETSRMCGIWSKGTSGQNMNPQIRLSNTYEMFFYAWKGQPVLNKAGRGNEFHCPPVPASQKIHPTERPLPLMREIYSTFAFPGSRVLIPFLGSGVGLLASQELGMSGTGFELSKAYKDSFLVRCHFKQNKGVIV
jgi:site-specific DNA-methyltransferase (adenine-specific)